MLPASESVMNRKCSASSGTLVSISFMASRMYRAMNSRKGSMGIEMSMRALGFSRMRTLFCLALLPGVPCAAALPFTVADEIGIAQFNDLDGAGAQVRFSPDGKYLAAYAERGRLDVNQVEGELRIYRSTDLRAFLHSERDAAPPAPWWT